VRLLGVSYSGSEYACIDGHGFFEGPADAALVGAIASWRANTLRLPLNEHCWLGMSGVPPAFSGEAYRRAIGDFVALARARPLRDPRFALVRAG